MIPRNDLLRVYHFGGGSYPSIQPTYPTKKQKVTRWGLTTAGGAEDVNIEGKQNWAKVSNTPMTEPGWVPFEEEITVVDQAKEETALAKEAADKEAALAKKRRGRASTILTKPGSIMGPPTLRTASLLGTKQRFGE